MAQHKEMLIRKTLIYHNYNIGRCNYKLQFPPLPLHVIKTLRGPCCVVIVPSLPWIRLLR